MNKPIHTSPEVRERLSRIQADSRTTEDLRSPIKEIHTQAFSPDNRYAALIVTLINGRRELLWVRCADPARFTMVRAPEFMSVYARERRAVLGICTSTNQPGTELRLLRMSSLQQLASVLVPSDV